MTRDDIIRMAREAGCIGPGKGGDPNGLWEPYGHENVTELMFAFADLVAAAERKIRAYTFLAAPPCPQGLCSAWMEREGVQLLCYYEFSPEQRGAREPTTGAQLEPDEPASVTLMHVYVRDVDILFLLSWEILDDLEREILQGDL